MHKKRKKNSCWCSQINVLTVQLTINQYLGLKVFIAIKRGICITKKMRRKKEDIGTEIEENGNKRRITEK